MVAAWPERHVAAIINAARPEPHVTMENAWRQESLHIRLTAEKSIQTSQLPLLQTYAQGVLWV
jgi:hypothetical protein